MVTSNGFSLTPRKPSKHLALCHIARTGGPSLRFVQSIAIALALEACFTDEKSGEPPGEFGTLTASVNGRPFRGAFGPDSTVAIYSAPAGQLQIGGNRRIGEWTERVQLKMICESTPEPGTYRISAPSTPVSAHVYRVRTRRWLPRPWRFTGQFFSSDSMSPGTLNVDTLDLSSGSISGRFTVGVRTYNQTPPDSLFLTGAFAGRVLTSKTRRDRFRWGPEQGRDCNSAKLR